MIFSICYIHLKFSWRKGLKRLFSFSKLSQARVVCPHFVRDEHHSMYLIKSIKSTSNLSSAQTLPCCRSRQTIGKCSASKTPKTIPTPMLNIRLYFLFYYLNYQRLFRITLTEYRITQSQRKSFWLGCSSRGTSLL